MTDQLKMVVPGKPEYVSTVRMAAASVAANAGFDIEAIDDIKVAISEACTNIVCHSHSDGAEFSYDVVLELSGDMLAIQVEDKGSGYDMEEYEEPVPGEPNEHGLGLFIIRALMDDVDVISEVGVGTNIRMTKHLPSQAQ